MSELNRKAILVATIAALCAGISCYLGELRGEHLMKRWQDTYYSEHMKEIRPDCIVPYKVHVEKSTNVLYWVCETYPVADANEAFKEGAKLGYQMALIGHGCEFCTPPIAPSPPKKAKPAKRKGGPNFMNPEKETCEKKHFEWQLDYWGYPFCLDPSSPTMGGAKP